MGQGLSRISSIAPAASARSALVLSLPPLARPVAAIKDTTEAMREHSIQRRARFGLSSIVMSDEFVELLAVVERLSDR